MTSVSRDEIRRAYRLVLGREPEGESAYQAHAGQKNYDRLLSSLMQSEEYKNLAGISPWSKRLAVGSMRGLKIAYPKDDWMFADIAQSGDYEPYVLDHFSDSLHSHSIVLDIGANIGIFSLVAAKVASKVIAVEASSENAKIIACNIALNDLENVDIYPVAASDGFGLVTFPKTLDTNKSLFPMDLTLQNIDNVDVSAGMPIDAIIENTDKIDIVKIDIEGHEYIALNSSKRIFSMRPTFFTEYSPDFLRTGSDVDGTDYLDLFTSNDYQIQIIHRDGNLEITNNSYDLIYLRWNEYMSRSITHLDLMIIPN